LPKARIPRAEEVTHKENQPMKKRSRGSKERGQSINVNISLEREAAHGYREEIGYGLWCLCVFGVCGGHRFYVGKPCTGILWFFTLELLGIGQLLDLLMMKRLVRSANLERGYVMHPRQAAALQTHQVTQEVVPPSPRPFPHKPEDLRQTLLRVASANGGELTVTQAVMETGESFEKVEKTLKAMVVKGYVEIDNAPHSGVVIYRFPELGR